MTDSDGYHDWKNSNTPPTAKMFKSTYCSDCTSFSTVFTLPSENERYYYVVSALNPSVVASGKVEFYYDGSGEYSESTEEEDNAGCFSEDALVHFINGSSLPLKNARIGDEILASSESGDVSYSPVIYNPHRYNDQHGHMIRITTSANISIVMTRNHLLMTCEASADGDCSTCMTSSASSSDWDLLLPSTLPHPPARGILLRADAISPNSTCLLTSASTSDVKWTKVISVSSSAAASASSRGMYTIVTREPYPIVDGVVVSPYANSHACGHMFYHMHRVAYTLGLSEHPMVASALRSVTDFMHDLLNMPQVKVIINQLFSISHAIESAL